LVINKESGELCLYKPEELDKPPIRHRIKNINEVLAVDAPPETLCYRPVAEGKKGNEKIHKNCVFCPHKVECFKDANAGKGLRIFKYNKGLSYFSKVVSSPRVEEVIA